MTNSTDATLKDLHAGLCNRPSPQEVARKLARMDLGDSLVGELRRLGHRRSWSSMTSTFATHPGVESAANAAIRLVEGVADSAGVTIEPCADIGDVGALEEWVGAAWALLGLGTEEAQAAVGKTARRDAGWFRTRGGGARGAKLGHRDIRGRYSRDELAVNLPGVSSRSYLKAVRAVAHLEQRAGVLRTARSMEECVRIGKSRLATTIALEDFLASPETAAFVAYYTARLNMRTLFTYGEQARPMDELAEALLQNAQESDGYRPDVVARVLTRQAVLAELSDAEKGDLLAEYWNAMLRVGAVLERTFDEKRDRLRMVARPGENSSEWNAASRAFNQLRTGWLNLTKSLGLEAIAEEACPGKVPALVAGDVAYIHGEYALGDHADTHVWAELPLPWKVITGEEVCTADMVREACSKFGMVAEDSGWTGAYRQDELAVTLPAPELVHGVQVGCPLLATLIRKSGALSGRNSQAWGPLEVGAAETGVGETGP